ncbi:MAG: TraB/GumN family protein [Candidatus Thorarchaeota archaeon]
MEKKVNENIILIGTAHVSKKSVAEVQHAIEKYKPDIVAVELDDKRYAAITEKDKWEKMDITEVVKTGKGFLLLAQMFLAMIQRKLGKEFGVEPGAEMIAAIDEAKKHRLNIALVDRDITITFKRAWRLMTFREKLRLFWYSTKAMIGYDRIDEELEEELEKELDKKVEATKEKKKGSKEKLKEDSKEESTEKPNKEEESGKDRDKQEKRSKEKILEKLMQEDVISAMMNELREVVPNATKALIDERDQYISKKIHGYANGSEKKFIKYKKRPKRTIKINEPETVVQPKTAVSLKKPNDGKKDNNRVLAVVGAGHLSGIKKNLTNPNKLPNLKVLEEVPKKRFSILKTVGYLIPILFVALFIYLIYFGEWDKLLHVLLAWFLINGICSAIGAAIALGHPLSILTAFFAAPITSLNPTIGAGWVAGYVEIKVRTPTVKDIRKLREIETMKDFFRNKLIKVLMVMALANLGSMIGTFVAGYYIGSIAFL